jgi:hypothetical protein
MHEFSGAAEPLSKKGFMDVIADLSVGIPEMLAVLAVESKNCGFLPDRRPIILFERHIFHKLTRGRFSDSHPTLSNKVAGGYAGLAKEYPRLAAAMTLDREAALKSASWGAGQIMGFNHAAAGFADVETMVSAMQRSEDEHLISVSVFLKKNNFVRFLKSRDWTALAGGYNGAAFSKNKYDVRLNGAFHQYASGALPDIEIRRAQLYLTYLGFDVGSIDGIHGKRSRSAVAEFRKKNELSDSDRVDKATLEAMQGQVRSLVTQQVKQSDRL